MLQTQQRGVAFALPHEFDAVRHVHHGGGLAAAPAAVDDDIDRMVKEAQAHEAEDKKQKETVEVRNRADSAVYQAEKAIKDLGDKVDKAKADEVQAAADKVKEALKGTDTDAIKKATEELEKPLYEMSAAAYQQAGGPEAAAGAGAAPGAGAADAGAKSEDDNVVDAEYTEVKDDKK